MTEKSVKPKRRDDYIPEYDDYDDEGLWLDDFEDDISFYYEFVSDEEVILDAISIKEALELIEKNVTTLLKDKDKLKYYRTEYKTSLTKDNIKELGEYYVVIEENGEEHKILFKDLIKAIRRFMKFSFNTVVKELPLGRDTVEFQIEIGNDIIILTKDYVDGSSFGILTGYTGICNVFRATDGEVL